MPGPPARSGASSVAAPMAWEVIRRGFPPEERFSRYGLKSIGTYDFSWE